MLKKTPFLLFTLLIISACSTYKELTPEPPVSPVERGYIELNSDGNWFELSADEKYFIQFPRTTANNMFLIIKSDQLSLLKTYFTRQFEDGGGKNTAIKDESLTPYQSRAYPLDQTVATFYWVIDSVFQDLKLEIEYRYIPIWRYQFETKYEDLKAVFDESEVSRQYLDSLGLGYTFRDVNLLKEIQDLEIKTNQLMNIQSELFTIRSLFPGNILNSTDPAIQTYQTFSEQVDSEINNHERYRLLLQVHQAERDSRINTELFSNSLPVFLEFFDGKESYNQNVVSETKRILGQRLTELGMYYDSFIKRKNDQKRLMLPVSEAERLHRECDVPVNSDFRAITSFTNAFNLTADNFERSHSELNQIIESVNSYQQWPEINFYLNIQSRMNKLGSSLPTVQTTLYGKYAGTVAVNLLNNDIRSLRQDFAFRESQYLRASSITQQTSTLRTQKNYKGIIRLIKQNSDLTFLPPQFREADDLSIKQQVSNIQSNMDRSEFRTAEENLKSLAQDRDFLYLANVRQYQTDQVDQFESQLFAKVKSASLKRANDFIKAQYTTILDVENLYNSPVFKPVHTLSYTAGDPGVLASRNATLQADLDRIKAIDFPEEAVTTLYSAFVANIDQNGVEKARAVATHGKFYKGDNRRVLNAIAECDYNQPKWITKATEYRKVYVLPATNNRTGKNEFIVKLNIKIPSNDEFPVFDINIRLPRDVAREAGNQVWFDYIGVNGEQIANEGRHTIVAPTPANDYESVITPVQMKKNADNIVEIRFRYPAFQVFEINVMAQKPLLKKN